jgi:RNA polymerase sigma-70 factor (ECF subfamily)
MSSLEFTQKLGQYEQILNSFAYSLTKNTEDSRDLYQETAYRALINSDKFEVGTNFKAWVFTIMKNIFINNYRKKQKAQIVNDSSDNQFLIDSSISGVVKNDAENKILVEEMTLLIEQLDPSIKVPFIMHYYGYKYQEIAEELDLPLGTIKSRIFFARQELKIQIEKRYGTKRLTV